MGRRRRRTKLPWRGWNMRQGSGLQQGKAGSICGRSCLNFSRIDFLNLFSCRLLLVKCLTTAVHSVSFCLILFIEALFILFNNDMEIYLNDLCKRICHWCGRVNYQCCCTYELPLRPPCFISYLVERFVTILTQEPLKASLGWTPTFRKLDTWILNNYDMLIAEFVRLFISKIQFYFGEIFLKLIISIGFTPQKTMT